MAEAVADGKSGKVVITNIGLLLSGDIDKPILDADTIVVNRSGLAVASDAITAVGGPLTSLANILTLLKLVNNTN